MTPSLIDTLVGCLLGTLPVLLFLACLIYLDSYKLISAESVLAVILAGVGSALASCWINAEIPSHVPINVGYYTRYCAPFIEETLKAAILVYLIRTRRVGFLVDAAIFGFAVGIGFAVVENLYFLQTRTGMYLTVWIIRSFGTATMHGAVSALFAIITKLLSDVQSTDRLHVYLPGTMVAVGANSFHNHFVLPPLASTAVTLLVFPALVFVIFRKSEKSLRQWLGMDLDSDVRLLELINSEHFPGSRLGRYLHSLRKSFTGPVAADMFCYLRIQAELAVRAKGAFIMHDCGFPVEPDPTIAADLRELERLEHRIGRIGRKALAPFSHFKDQDYRQLYRLAGMKAAAGG